MWVVIVALASCQDLAGGTQGSAGDTAQETAKTESVTVAEGYPSLHTVPPRPELSYTVKQRRAIVEGLVADRENARYTSAMVRYRAGLSSMPPPESKPVAAVPLELGPEPRDDAAARSVAPIDRPDVDQTPGRTYDRDDLDSFMQDLLDTKGAARGEPQARAAPRGAVPPGAKPSAAPVLAADAPQVRAQVVPATMPVRPPAPANTSGAATAAAESRHVAPPSPAPRRPAAAASAAGVAAGRTPVEKPAAETATIDVAGGLVAVEVAPDDPEPALTSVAFVPGSAALAPDEQARLERFLGEANARGARVKIVGEAAAPALALDRARAVGLALVQGGLPADRLEMTLAHDGAGDRARLFLASP